ncbi:MAG: nitronate monooxygenase [Kiritimatiellaeota bacterium]|nr:nitronate monooxygenase [Kiritimatiellota bacterium]
MDMPALRIGDLTCSVPIVQGGMGVGISLSGLAAAVAEQGGIGVLASVGLAMLRTEKSARKAHIEVLTDEIRKVREKTRGVLGVNIMMALTNFSDLVETAIREKVDIIFSGAGLPLNLPRYLTEGAKTKLVPIVSSGRAAALICRRWLRSFNYLPDAFVLEGPLAGGHLGFRREQIDDPSQNLKALLSGVLEAVKPYEEKCNRQIPVIAAGGIYTGQDVYEIIAAGAAGAQMGTRFVATDECDADQAFKEAYLAAKEEDVRIINSPVGLPGRVIRNEFVDSIEKGERVPVRCPFRCLINCDSTKTPYCIAEALLNAVRGKLREGFAFAGANVHRVSEIVSVKTLIDSLQREYRLAASASACSQQPRPPTPRAP